MKGKGGKGKVGKRKGRRERILHDDFEWLSEKWLNWWWRWKELNRIEMNNMFWIVNENECGCDFVMKMNDVYGDELFVMIEMKWWCWMIGLKKWLNWKIWELWVVFNVVIELDLNEWMDWVWWILLVWYFGWMFDWMWLCVWMMKYWLLMKLILDDVFDMMMVWLMMNDVLKIDMMMNCENMFD